jgi:hypothetical protein
VLGGGDQLDRDRIGEVLDDELLLANALQPEGGSVHGRFGMHEKRVVDVPDIPKRHPAFAKGLGNSTSHEAYKRRI